MKKYKDNNCETRFALALRDRKNQKVISVGYSELGEVCLISNGVSMIPGSVSFILEYGLKAAWQYVKSIGCPYCCKSDKLVNNEFQF